jgi:hypothetical protein
MKTYLQLLCALLISNVSIAANLSASASAADKGKKNGFITLTISGGFAPYVINWTGPSGYSSSKTNPDSLAAGKYCVVVTDAYCGVASLCIDVTEKTNTGIIESKAAAYTIYPNPCSNLINIDVASNYSGMLDMQLFDATGRLIAQQYINAQSKIKWQLANALPTGTYILRLRQEDGSTFIQRIIAIDPAQ